MIIFKSPEYSCLWICNVDDVKVIDWIEADLTIWTGTNTWTKQERQTTSHKDDEQNNVALRRRNHERKNEIDMKITYFNKREREKRVRGVFLGQKLTLNHASLMDEREETRVLETA